MTGDWISVDDELPGKFTTVLIVFSDREMWTSEFIGTDDDGKPLWIAPDSLDFGYGQSYPTHWMPLPDPPP